MYTYKKKKKIKKWPFFLLIILLGILVYQTKAYTINYLKNRYGDSLKAQLKKELKTELKLELEKEFQEKLNTLVRNQIILESTQGKRYTVEKIKNKAQKLKVFEIKKMQVYLNQLGFYSQKINGKMTQDTISAIVEFQKQYGYKITGMAIMETLWEIENIFFPKNLVLNA